MPVDLSPSNAIIQSFLAGTQLARQKRDETEEQKRRREDTEFREQQAQEAIRQFNEQLSRQKAQFNAQIKLSQAAANREELELQNKFMQQVQTGLGVPPGFEETGIESFEMGPGMAGTISTFKSPDFPRGFRAKDPTSFAIEQAEMQRILSAPKLEAEKEIKGIEAVIKAQEIQQQHLNRMKQIELQNQGRLEAAKLRGQDTKNDPAERLLDANEQEIYGLPAGAKVRDTFGKMPGIKLSAPQQEDLKALQLLEIQNSRLESLLNDVGWENYYKGKTVGGGFEDLKRLFGAERAEKIEQITVILGDIKSLISHERFGTALSVGEKQRLQEFEPSSFHTTNVNAAKARITNFKNSVVESKKLLEQNALGRTLSPRGNNQNRPSLDSFVVPPGGR